MSLVKAYLKGVNDPIALAKEYYDDMLHKSVEAVERLIREELSFDMEKDMKEWNKEIKETQDEIKFWSKLHMGVSNSDAGKNPIMERTTQAMSEDAETPEEVETIPYSEIPAYIKELRGHIKNTQANINDANDEYQTLVEKITGEELGDYKQPRGRWPDELFIKIHTIGLEYIESKLASYVERFEILKESGEIPQVRPETLNRIDAKIKQQLKAWEKMFKEGKSRPSYSDRQEILRGIESAFGSATPEWRYRYYESKIQEWENLKKRSLKELKEHQDSQEDTDEPDIEIKPKEEKEKKDRKDMPDEFKGNLFYSDDTWWKQLKVESEHVTESSEISTRKEFQTALEDYFKNPSSTFDIPVIPGNKTATGIGGVEIVDGKPKRIKENPATRLANLKKLYTIFEKLPDAERSKSDVKTIMDGLKAEMEHWDVIISSKSEGKLTFGEEGKRILKLLVTELDKAFTSIRDYKDELEEKPQRFIQALNKIKETGLKLNELKIFSKGKVTIKSLTESEDKEIRERATRLVKTFDSSSANFTKVVEKLNRPIKGQEDTVLSRLERHWYDDDVKSVSGKSKDEQTALDRQMDRLLGKFEVALDNIEGSEVDIKDEYLDERIESALEQLQESLENIQGSIEQEGMEFEGTTIDVPDDALDWFIDTYEVWQDEVAFVLQQLNPSNPDYIKIMELKDKIIDELEKLPQLQGLIDFNLKSRRTTPNKVLQDRRNLAEHLQKLIAMSKIEGSKESKQEWLKSEDSIKNHIEGRLGRATTANGKKKRERLINKIMKDIEFKPSDFNWDVKQTVSRQRMLREIDEEYDESDVGQRETEEMIEGGEDILEDEFDIGELSGRYESERGE